MNLGNDMLTVSIVTPSYNQGEFLEQCLLSVKRQAYPAIEHLVIDGGSTDNTLEILKRYSCQPGWEHLKWISEPDRGQSEALNKGFRAATGQVIGWLNSDDVYLPGSPQEVVETFQKQKNVDLIYGDYFMIDKDGKLVETRKEVSFNRFVLRHTHVNFVQSSSACFFSRRVVDEGHFIDESYHYAMDYEYFVRLTEAGYRFQHLSKLLGGFRLHRQTKSSLQTGKQLREHERVRRQNHGLPLEGKIPSAWRIRLGLLRCCANVLRWGEKALRGYYFTQWRIDNFLRYSKYVQIH